MLRASERRIKINARERRGRECEEKKGEHQRGQCPLIVGPTPKKPRVEQPEEQVGRNTNGRAEKEKEEAGAAKPPRRPATTFPG